jgi:hypothetical protein
MTRVSPSVLALFLLSACASPGGPPPSSGRDAMAPVSPARRNDSGASPAGAPDVGGGSVSPGPGLDSALPFDTGATEAATAAPDLGGGPSDPPPPSSAGALETVRVSASGQPVRLQTSLAAGEIYLLKASGAVDLAGQRADAEYSFGAGAPADEAGGADVGIDVGLKQIHRHVHYTPTPPGPGRMKWTGYRDDHVYYMLVTGEGAPLSLALTRPAGATGSGEITVALYPLSPAPPKLGPELETVMVPVLKTVVSGTVATTAGKPYLLQAQGAGKVGGGGLHMGDAEYMDWDAEGNKANEGEAGADFGIGVDELAFDRMSGAAYKPRERWWGPWRKDHTYYLLFTGTGKPIQFLYFDSGYGDNSPTDKLSVRIFAAP